jgi:hypothetical protein
MGFTQTFRSLITNEISVGVAQLTVNKSLRAKAPISTFVLDQDDL